jgi:hypothetical protein
MIDRPKNASRRLDVLDPDAHRIAAMIVSGENNNNIQQAFLARVRQQLASQGQKYDYQKDLDRLIASATKSLEDKLNKGSDDAQLANVDLQNILQKQQQTLQMMSNISKMLYDTAQAVIRKMGG